MNIKQPSERWLTKKKIESGTKFLYVYDFMSSEESGKDDLEEECIFVKSIPW